MTTATVVKPKEEAKPIVKKVQKAPRKTVFVDLTPPIPKVTFTGGLWTVMDVKHTVRAIKLDFKKMLRELYRKEYKEK